MPFLLIVFLAAVFVWLCVTFIKKVVPPPNPAYPAEQIFIPVIKLMWIFTFLILFLVTVRLVL